MEHTFDWPAFVWAGKAAFVLAGVVLVGYAGWTLLAPGASAYRRVGALAAQGPSQALETFSTTTPERVIERLSVASVMPPTGKFIVADLAQMQLTLYQDGAPTATYSILTKGRPGTPYETPSGFYSVLTKEEDHFNAGEEVHMPYSMQFYGNYFIHGWPYYPGGTPVASSYSGGCIRLSTADAAKVYAFATLHTPLFVYDAPSAASSAPAPINPAPPPRVSAESYLVADLDTDDVYLEREAQVARPIASLTKLMSALVANETIMFDKHLSIPLADLAHSSTTPTTSGTGSFVVGDLLYPLLMESNNAVADDLARYYGTKGFVAWMNSTAASLGMASTSYADPSGVSAENVSTPDDLFRLARYLADRKSFIFDISRTPAKTITDTGGGAFRFDNFNIFASSSDFIGGKVGKTGAAGETILSLFSVPAGETTRRVAIIVLHSADYTSDTEALAHWAATALAGGAQAACATCAAPHYRKIEP